jgi:hypothetical protein
MATPGIKLMEINSAVADPRRSIYDSLDESQIQTRVLHILPALDFQADIHAILSIVSLSDKGPPFFNALSYCWGDPSDRRPIQINGHKKFITSSLETALRHLRKKDEDLIIWADAICINQDDIEERGSQVQIMSEIYKSASSVIVWLGEEGDDSDCAMDTCADWGGNTLKPGAENRLYIIQHVVEGGFSERPRLAIRNLLRRPYWSRLWIYQEVQLARNVVVRCGVKEISWQSFAGLYEAWYQIHRKKIMLEQAVTAGNWDLIESCKLDKLMLFFDLRRAVKELADPAFFLLLRRTADQDCTDPKDRMYAVMSLGKDKTQYPRPDYRKSVTFAEVYSRFSRARIRMTGCLDSLNEAASRLYDQKPDRGDLPSWSGLEGQRSI